MSVPSHLTAGVSGLAEVFSRQDYAVQCNYEAAQVEFSLVERGAVLGLAVTLWLNEDSILSQRQAKPVQESTSETIFINLLWAAWASLVDATRLALFGAHIDALALTRSAFEAAYHAEYFRDHPADAIEWDQAGRITELGKLHEFINKFNREKKVLSYVDCKYPGQSLRDFYRELSTYGTHINPKTVALRLASQVREKPRLGFMSWGYTEAPRLCANYILHTLGYVLSEYFDACGAYLNENADIVTAYEEFQRDLEARRANAPAGGLSLNT